FCGTLWMVFHIFGLSGLEQAAFFHNLGQMKEALPLNSLFNYFETTPFFLYTDPFYAKMSLL
ncbi:MAG: hypothetical protein IKI69_07550, partial [Oscillospiraceae bacterium]|nr:hypothetical protein [Oscillospiraceae bacterium]